MLFLLAINGILFVVSGNVLLVVDICSLYYAISEFCAFQYPTFYFANFCILFMYLISVILMVHILKNHEFINGHNLIHIYKILIISLPDMCHFSFRSDIRHFFHICSDFR